jgi:hypothetical protein
MEGLGGVWVGLLGVVGLRVVAEGLWWGGWLSCYKWFVSWWCGLLAFWAVFEEFLIKLIGV